MVNEIPKRKRELKKNNKNEWKDHKKKSKSKKINTQLNHEHIPFSHVLSRLFLLFFVDSSFYFLFKRKKGFYRLLV